MEIIGFRVRKNKVKEINVDVDKLVVKVTATSILIISAVNGNVVHAEGITESLQPLVNILKDLAEPVSYGFMIKGFMKIMSGDEHEGMKTIKNSIGGFVGIQIIPQIFKVIKGLHF